MKCYWLLLLHLNGITAFGKTAFSPFSSSSSSSSSSLSSSFSYKSNSNYGNEHNRRKTTRTSSSTLVLVFNSNSYDSWISDGLVEKIHASEENVRSCLVDLIESEYGQQMFGVHEKPASVGITGEIEFVELCGPEVTLSLAGKFWHRRETVLSRTAVWLNARMPEISEVSVQDLDELKDEQEVRDEHGEILYRFDKRAPDFDGDRGTMEYQGVDPDDRGPFPSGVGGLRAGGSMLN